MFLERASQLLGDTILLGLIVAALPLAILVVGTPIALFIRLILEIVERI